MSYIDESDEYRVNTYGKIANENSRKKLTVKKLKDYIIVICIISFKVKFYTQN